MFEQISTLLFIDFSYCLCTTKYLANWGLQARHRLDGVVYAVKITKKKAKRNSRDEKVSFSCTGNMLKF